MAIVQISGIQKPVAVALDWAALTGTTGERKEIEQLSKEHGSKIGCLVSDDESSTTVLGLAAERSAGTYCGAAWLAAAVGRASVVLAEPLSDGRVWVCAIKNGTPVQRRDQVTTEEQLHETLKEFLGYDEDAKIFSTIEGLGAHYSNVSHRSFAELVSEVKKPAKLVRIAGTSPAFIAIVTCAVVGGIAYYGGGAWLDHQRRLENQAKLAQINAQQQETAEANRRRLDLEHRNKGEALLRSVVLDQATPSDLLKSVFGVVEDMPTTLAGWELESVDCVPSACSVKWTRLKGGTVLSFLHEADRRGWQVDAVEGSDAVTSHVVNGAPRVAALDVLEEGGAFRAAFETKLQEAELAGLKYEFGKVIPIDDLLPKPAPAAKGPSPQLVVLTPLPWKVGTTTVRGSALFELRDLGSYVDHPAIAFSHVQVNLKRKEWIAESKFATK
jgi:hypothetical protein